MWEKGKECFLFEAQTITMSSELYNTHRSKIIQYPKGWGEVNGLKALSGYYDIIQEAEVPI